MQIKPQVCNKKNRTTSGSSFSIFCITGMTTLKGTKNVSKITTLICSSSFPLISRMNRKITLKIVSKTNFQIQKQVSEDLIGRIFFTISVFSPKDRTSSNMLGLEEKLSMKSKMFGLQIKEKTSSQNTLKLRVNINWTRLMMRRLLIIIWKNNNKSNNKARWNFNNSNSNLKNLRHLQWRRKWAWIT